MSRQKSPTDIVSAIYNAEKQEVVHSFYVAVSFIIAGIITIIVSLIKFAKISGNATDSSDNINSFAWLVIAVVGLVVAMVGAITIIKSMIGLGQVGSAAETMESHASPFHAQEVTHQVTAMNQAHSLRKADNSDDGMLGERGKSASRGTPAVVQAPKPAEPMMQQKFDYGIHEKKELTFAEKFMLENKKDPFEQYRKDLGIEDEKEEFFEPKPQFIHSSNSQAPTVIQQPVVQQPVVQQQATVQQPAATQKPITQQRVTQQQTKKPVLQKQSAPQQPTASSAKTSPSSSSKSAPKFVSKGNDNEADSIINKYLDSNYNNGTGTTAPVPLSSKEAQDDFFYNYGKNNSSDSDTEGSAPTADLSKVENIFENTQEQDLYFSDSDASPATSLDLSYFDSNFNSSENSADISENTSSSNSESVSNDEFDFDLEYTTTLQDKSFDNYFPQNTVSGMNALGSKDKPQAFNVKQFLAQSNSQNKAPIPMQKGHGQNSPTASVSDKHDFDMFAESKSKRKTTQNERDTAESNAKAKSKTNLFSAFKSNKKAPAEEQPKQEKPKVNHEICINGTPSQRKHVEASEYDEWVCSNCGKVNQEYVGVCACGSRKPRSKS